VEIMTASDNVLRGGLTPKHVDVPELLRVLRFDTPPARPIAGKARSSCERVYPTPCAEFELSRLDLGPGRAFARGPVRGAEALLVVDGEADLASPGGNLSLPRGSAVLVPNGLRYSLGASAEAVVFRASIPGAQDQDVH
jgi:mannose-6-phosphate isomerase